MNPGIKKPERVLSIWEEVLLTSGETLNRGTQLNKTCVWLHAYPRMISSKNSYRSKPYFQYRNWYLGQVDQCHETEERRSTRALEDTHRPHGISTDYTSTKMRCTGHGPQKWDIISVAFDDAVPLPLRVNFTNLDDTWFKFYSSGCVDSWIPAPSLRY